MQFNTQSIRVLNNSKKSRFSDNRRDRPTPFSRGRTRRGRVLGLRSAVPAGENGAVFLIIYYI